MNTGKEIMSTLPGPTSHATRLPLLVDISLTVSQIFILIVAIVTAVLSIFAHADTLTVILRTAVAIICVGLPVYVLNLLLGRFFVQATLNELGNARKEKENNENLEEHSGELEAIA